jgi:ribosomal protein S18 acetylase RimI-like enzyme
MRARSPSLAVRPLCAADCDSAAVLDVTARTTATLGFLGAPFHAALYRAVLGGPEAFGLAAEAEGQLVGFVLAADDGPRALRGALRRALLRLAQAAFVACCRRPASVRFLVSALRYPATGEGPELLVISVDPAWQRRGVARALVGALDATFTARGIARYRVSTKVRTSPAVRLYEGLGFTRVRTFALFEEPWVVFERRLFSDEARR